MKYEEVYLKAYDTVAQARSSLGRYSDLYNVLPTDADRGGMKFSAPYRGWRRSASPPRPNPMRATPQIRHDVIYRSGSYLSRGRGDTGANFTAGTLAVGAAGGLFGSNDS